ncbi:response regulator [Shigella sonnei]
MQLRDSLEVINDSPSVGCLNVLAGAGLTCTTFENGAEVLEALASKTPDVLLSDIRMPGMDGLAGSSRLNSAILCFRSSL